MNNELIDLPLISIIVPVYNVELYLHKCVDSIIKQTYKNLQIILVDDGSKDKCSQICDEYSMVDERIEVVHQVNGGLSDARNTGVKYAKGEYVFFLDSDDWLEDNAIEILFKALIKHNCDLAVANYYYQYDNHKDIANHINDDYVFNKNKAMEELLKNDIVKNFAWGKLYKYDFIKDYPFPKGKLFEDTYWSHLIFDQCNKIVLLKEPLVHYYQRSNSISYTFNIKKIHLLEGYLERRTFIKENYKDFISLVDDSIIKLMISLYLESLRNYSYKTHKTMTREIKKVCTFLINEKDTNSKELHYLNVFPFYFVIKKVIEKLRG